jgi:hypothetical protein
MLHRQSPHQQRALSRPGHRSNAAAETAADRACTVASHLFQIIVALGACILPLTAPSTLHDLNIQHFSDFLLLIYRIHTLDIFVLELAFIPTLEHTL